MARFTGTTNGDKHHGLRLYVWNARLCEEFYLPIQLAEVAVRNAIAATLTRRFGADWFDSTSFTSLLPTRYQNELAKLVADEKYARGDAFTVDHVISGLTFGFWVNLLTRSYDQILWQGGVKRSFPHITNGTSRIDVYSKVDDLRVFRNKVMHHFAIYDRKPSAEYSNILEVIGMICPDTAWLLRQLANPARVLQARPKF